MRLALLSALAGSVLAGVTSAQSFEPVPLRDAGTWPGTDLPLLQADAAGVLGLSARPTDEVVLGGFRMPSGQEVDLELRRIDLARRNFGFRVDGVPAPNLLEGLDISVWTGTVRGAPGSEVVLSFSNRGTRGWVNTGAELAHLMPQPGMGGNWDESVTIVATEEALRDIGMEPRLECDLEDLPARADAAAKPAAPFGGPTGGQGGVQELGGCTNWTARIAIETDFQLFQVFGSDLGAETAYMTTLLAAVSDRYETQINTVLQYPYVQFYTTSNDPWSVPDSGTGNTSEMLNEFRSAWQFNLPVEAEIAHFVSGASLGGGIAYLGVLCDTQADFSFAVSANIDGLVPFPVQSGPTTWDFMVFAHETGHNFNSPHTHDYNPQIDDCANGTCVTDGTVMSYCHLCPGGLTNITTFFHPTVINVMQGHANACLPFFAPLVNDTEAPVLIAPGATTPLTVDLLGTPVGNVLLNYRFDNGAFSTVAATLQGGSTYAATLPAAQCGDSPEWFFSVTDASCGPYQTATRSSGVGVASVAFDDDMEVNTGWTVGAAGDTATTGVWERGNPIGTAAQPEDDHTPSGTDCWFTGQGSPGGSLGENDVDGGATTLTSPVLDASSGDPSVSYWRWYSNDTGGASNADVFTVDISNNGGSTWTNVETIGPAGAGTSGGWVYHEFVVSDFVTPTANVQLRFVAEDAGDGSLIEAAVDDLQIFDVDCGATWVDLGGGAAGIAGIPQLTMSGSLLPGSDLTLELVDGAPSALSFIWFSFSSTPAPFLGGTLHAFPIDIQVLAFTSAGGVLAGTATFPGATSGQGVWVQVAVADGTAVGGGSLSNGVTGTVP